LRRGCACTPGCGLNPASQDPGLLSSYVLIGVQDLINVHIKFGLSEAVLAR
jgi:hypothetical protein